jgi:hypothetical protein
MMLLRGSKYSFLWVSNEGGVGVDEYDNDE